MGSRNHSNYGSPNMNMGGMGMGGMGMGGFGGPSSPPGSYGYGPQPGQPQHPSLQPKYMQVLAAEMKIYTAEVLRFQDEIRRLK